MSASAANLVLDIAIESDGWQSFEGFEELAEHAIGAAIQRTQVKIQANAEVSIVLCDDAFICELNKKWRGIDKPTNVLSFPASETNASGAPVLGPLLGDILIAYETAKREAGEENKSLRAHAAHLIIHGFLHLIGYDHVVTAEAEEMEALECAILSDLGIDDPYRGAFVQIAES